MGCESFGPYCLIGGLAVNCYVEPVYEPEAEIVAASRLPPLPLASRSDLRIQFTTDERYQAFLTRSAEGQVLGVPVRIACLGDIVRGKLWAYSDPQRRLSKRKKDGPRVTGLPAATGHPLGRGATSRTPETGGPARRGSPDGTGSARRRGSWGNEKC